MPDPRISKRAEVLLRGLVQNDQPNDSDGKVIFQAFGLGSPLSVTSRTITEPILSDVPLLTELFDAKLIAYYGNTRSANDYRFVLTQAGHEYVDDRRASTRARNAALPVAAGIIGGVLAFVLFPGETAIRTFFITLFGVVVGAALGRAAVRAPREGLSIDVLLEIAVGLVGAIVAIAAPRD